MSEPSLNTGAQSPKVGARPRKGQEDPQGGAGRKPQASQASPEKEPASDGAPGRIVTLSAIDRDGMISVAAYYRAEQRNFEPGRELEDWLAAEAEINSLLLGGQDSGKTPF